MIVIKLEMWPKGDHTRARNLGTAAIWNVGGDVDTGDYECRLFKSPEYSRTNAGRSIEEMCTRPLARETWRKGRVEGFPRLRFGPWDLLFRALGALISDRNTGVEFNADVHGDSFEEGGLPTDADE